LTIIFLTPRRAAGPEPEYEFKHAMTQEVSYQSLTFGMRESLHERCGLMIEEEVGTDRLGQYDVKANVNGGGQTGQAGALRLAVARALVKIDESHRRKLRDLGLLTRDARAVERKKPGRPKARKRFQFSKR